VRGDVGDDRVLAVLDWTAVGAPVLPELQANRSNVVMIRMELRFFILSLLAMPNLALSI